MPSTQSSVEQQLREADAPGDADVVYRVAERIVKRHRRDALDPLMAALASRRLGPRAEGAALEAIVIIADPDNRLGLRPLKKRPPADSFGEAVTAVGLSDEVEARDVLVRLAVGEYDRSPKASSRLSLLACGFLRANGDPQSVREGVRHPLWNPSFLPMSYVAALVSSLDFRRSLDDVKARQDYIDFERQLWRAYAVVPKGSAKGSTEYELAAATLATQWNKAYEPFLHRVLQSPLLTSEERRVAMFLVARLHLDALKGQVKAVAEGGSPDAPYATEVIAAFEAPLHRSLGFPKGSAPH